MLLAWLLMQQGPSGMHESIEFAIKAATLGFPVQTLHTFNNAVAHLPSDPALGARLGELMQYGTAWGGADLVGQGWNLIAQGHTETGLKLMMTPGPWPLSEPQFRVLVEQAQARLRELDTASASASRKETDFTRQVEEAQTTIDKAKDDLVTSARQTGLLVTTISSDATNALFKADATRNTKESKGAWRSGLAILGGAAVVAVLPLVLHYLNVGPAYTTIEQIGVHLASTAALATFAGVLLARARSRDRAAQRAHDLSTAMGTMISYSNQISDPIEKQRFMMAMGQVVLQAHLSAGPGPTSSDDGVAGMVALANLIRPAGSASNGAS